MGNPLDPSLLDRARRALRPDWSRTPTARRIVAGGLVLLAAVAAWRGDPGTDYTDVVVTVRDLSPGVELSTGDVQVQPRAAGAVPAGAHTRVDAVVGTTLAGPARSGEVLTDVRLLGPRLAEAAAGPDARIVPVPLADPALMDLLRPGDVVDIVAAPADALTEAKLIATDAVVVLVSAEEDGIAAHQGRVVLVALPAAAAKAVAGVALAQAVTLTLH